LDFKVVDFRIGISEENQAKPSAPSSQAHTDSASLRRKRAGAGHHQQLVEKMEGPYWLGNRRARVLFSLSILVCNLPTNLLKRPFESHEELEKTGETLPLKILHCDANLIKQEVILL
jgi:hypothetical protein